MAKNPKSPGKTDCTRGEYTLHYDFQTAVKILSPRPLSSSNSRTRKQWGMDGNGTCHVVQRCVMCVSLSSNLSLVVEGMILVMTGYNRMIP